MPGWSCWAKRPTATSEFYRMRDRITRALIERKGFAVVAVEADWPDAARIDAWVRHRPVAAAGLVAVRALPALDVAQRRDGWASSTGCARRMRTAPPEDRVSFHGLDLYSLHISIGAVLDYLDAVDSRGRRGRAGAVRLPDRLAACAGSLRPRRPDAGLRRLAARRWSPPCATCNARAGRAGRTRRRAAVRRPAQRQPDRQCGRILPHHVRRAARPPGTCATATCLRPWRRCSTTAGPGRGRWSGRTTAMSATPPRPRWPRGANTTIGLLARQRFGDGA